MLSKVEIFSGKADYDSVQGLCGNFNDNPDDDLQMPQGHSGGAQCVNKFNLRSDQECKEEFVKAWR